MGGRLTVILRRDGGRLTVILRRDGRWVGLSPVFQCHRFSRFIHYTLSTEKEASGGGGDAAAPPAAWVSR
jgi:hypothetical protein